MPPLGFPSDRAAVFARLVKSDSAALGSATLWALLQSPSDVVARQGKRPDTFQEEEVELRWQREAEYWWEPLGCPLLHEVSQPFERPLSFGRSGCFRVQRFLLGTRGLKLCAELAEVALQQEEETEGLQVSNVGGFHSRQDLFRRPGNALRELRDLAAFCVASSAGLDAKDALEALGADPDGWANVSRVGDLNLLHHHADATVATVFYAKVPEATGSLLLRLSPGFGPGMMEPDEARHVPWLFEAKDPEPLVRGGAVRFAQVAPEQGALLVFPGWLSHSVAPGRGSSPRISFASNWDLPTEENEE